MLSYAILAASLLPLGLAWDSEYPVFCNDTQPGPCFSRQHDECYKCLHPIEAACPGTGKDFTDCFCPIPSTSWAAFEKCFNDPSTGCAPGGLDDKLLLNLMGTTCSDYNQFICQPGTKLDTVEQKYSSVNCDDAVSTDGPISQTGAKLPASTTAAVQTTAAPSVTASSSHPTATPPTVKPSSTTPPTSVAIGAAGLTGPYAALLLAGAVIAL